MNTRQCTPSVYSNDAHFLNHFFSADVNVLYFCAFPPSAEIGSFSSFWSLNQYLQAILHHYKLALHYRSIWKPVFLERILHVIHLLFCYKLYYVRRLSNIGVLLVFPTLVFYFPIRRPTCVSVSMIVSLIYLFATCGCFRRYEEIGGS